MTTSHHVDELMRTIGARAGLDEVRAYEDGWILLDDDETVVFAVHDQADDLLTLWANIAIPPETDRLGTYALLLRYNSL